MGQYLLFLYLSPVYGTLEKISGTESERQSPINIHPMLIHKNYTLYGLKLLAETFGQLT